VLTAAFLVGEEAMVRIDGKLHPARKSIEPMVNVAINLDTGCMGDPSLKQID
jgi:hypothetical protein